MVGGQVVLGQEADLERGLGDAGQSRLVGRPGLLVEVAPEPVRDVVVGEPLLGDLRVAVVEARGLGLELVEEGAIVLGRVASGGGSRVRIRQSASSVLAPRRAAGVHSGRDFTDRSDAKDTRNCVVACMGSVRVCTLTEWGIGA